MTLAQLEVELESLRARKRNLRANLKDALEEIDVYAHELKLVEASEKYYRAMLKGKV